MSAPRTVVWFSCGAASAVAAKLTLVTRTAVIAYCDTRSEHKDNARFLMDCEQWFGQSSVRLHNDDYDDTWSVWVKERYLSGVHGAPCTGLLKIRPRLEFQRPTDVHVFGYTADKTDQNRVARLREHYPEMHIETPLIKRGLTKANCLAIIRRAGIKVPVLYGLGFKNNNCIPCAKAQSAAYWALVRKHFPIEFARMAKLSRELGVRMCVIAKERCFLDEIPENQPTNDPIVATCDFLCQAADLSMHE